MNISKKVEMKIWMGLENCDGRLSEVRCSNEL